MKPTQIILTVFCTVTLIAAGLALLAALPMNVSAALVAPTATAVATATPTVIASLPASTATPTALPTTAATVSAEALPAGASSAAQPGSITVTGNAQVMVAPDEVVLYVGIETNDMILSTAKDQNDTVIKRVLEITKRYNIEAKDVQTDYINIEPRYKDNYEKSSFLGYFVRKTVQIRLGDISKFESLYTDLLEAGINQVQGIEFRTTELRKYRDEARALALKAAQEKAAALAGGVGEKTGRVVMIREDYSGWSGSYNSWWYRSSGMMSQNVVQNTGGGEFNPEETLAPGQIAVNATITVEFELVP